MKMKAIKSHGPALKRPARANAADTSVCLCGNCPPAAATKADVCACNDKDCQFCEARLYSGLPDKQVQSIRSSLSRCQSVTRQTLFRAGDPSTYLYVIREGQVKLTRTDIDGHEHLLNLTGAGYFLGFDTIGNPRYSYSAETLTPTVLCRIKHSDIVQLL